MFRTTSPHADDGCQFPDESSDTNPLIAKIQRFVRLDPMGIAAVERLCVDPKDLPADHVIIEEGSRPDQVTLLLRGLAFRYKYLPDGRRQILGYLLPGDFCGAHFAVFDPIDHGIALMSDSCVAKIEIQALLDLLACYPKIERGLSLAALVDQAILREWLLNIGQRDAYQKLSHFFCEMAVRLKAVGLANSDGSLDLALNQAVLADTTGLSPVHTNRMLQRLRSEGLIVLRKRRLTITDPARLAMVSGFKEHYLRIAHFPD